MFTLCPPPIIRSTQLIATDGWPIIKIARYMRTVQVMQATASYHDKFDSHIAVGIHMCQKIVLRR